MEQKNYTQVLIDGTIYTLSGNEDELYLQKVAAYLSDKISKLKKSKGFGRLNSDYRALMIELNVTDDYFKEQTRADLLAEQKTAMERDSYSLKHELITTQMKLESLQKEIEEYRGQEQELKAKLAGMQGAQTRIQSLEAELAQLPAARARVKELEQELVAAKSENARTQELEERLAAAQADNTRIAELESQLEAVTAENEQLQEMKAEYDDLKADRERRKALEAAAAAVEGFQHH
jgi:cell division protein ZapA (FtsZ GTPase activity inhibitor)